MMKNKRNKRNTRTKQGFIAGLVVTMFTIAMIMITPATLHAASPTPGKVTLMKISSSAYNRVTISWKKTTNATHYKIYYRKSGTSRWTGLKTVGSNTTSYTHIASSSKPIVVGQKYDYTVRGYNSRSRKNGSYNTKGLTIATRPNTVKIGKVSLNSSKTQATVTWSKASGANQYLIYRKTPGTGWKRLATVGSSTLKYTDKNPIKGQTNTYTVKSYYSKTKTSGRYNSKGISIAVPASDTKPNPSKVQRIDIRSWSSGFQSDGAVGDVMAEVFPSTAANKKIIWEIKIIEGPSGALTIDSNGKMTAHGKKGDYAVARVYARSAENPSIYATADVIIDIKDDISEYPAEVFRLTNLERAKYGLPPLKYHKKLEQAAMIRAKELEQLFEHKRPDGSRIGTICGEVGFGDLINENIGRGLNSTPAALVWAWMTSPGHRDAILSSEANYIGIGFYQGLDGEQYWVQVFANEPDKTYTITFDSMGGSEVAPIHPYKRGPVYEKDLPVPIKDGYKFDGWYYGPAGLDPDYLARYHGVQLCESDEHLYAKWIPA